MNEHHLDLIRKKLKAFCFSFEETSIKAVCILMSGWPHPAYLVLLQGEFCSGVVRCQIVGELYCEARVVVGSV